MNNTMRCFDAVSDAIKRYADSHVVSVNDLSMATMKKCCNEIDDISEYHEALWVRAMVDDRTGVLSCSICADAEIILSEPRFPEHTAANVLANSSGFSVSHDADSDGVIVTFRFDKIFC